MKSCRAGSTKSPSAEYEAFTEGGRRALHWVVLLSMQCGCCPQDRGGKTTRPYCIRYAGQLVCGFLARTRTLRSDRPRRFGPKLRKTIAIIRQDCNSIYSGSSDFRLGKTGVKSVDRLGR